MTLLRRVSYGALALAFAHIVFGAIVRITGSGLGCGDHWPRCHGYWFPPFTRMDLVIEVMHRYLAFGLSMTILTLLVLAFRRRHEPGVGGPGGVLRPVALASVLVVSAAVFGGIVVKLELRNKYVIVVHLAIAISTLAALALAAIRAGGLGGGQAVAGTSSAKTARAAVVAAVMAFLAVVLGGLTAHVVGANGACVGFPHCPRGIPTPGAPLHIHLTHRVVAFLLFFHLLGMVFAVRKRRESSLIQWATRIAFGTVVLQILVAAALVELYLPPVLRSLHQAVGTLVWLSIFVLAALARRGSRDAGDGAQLAPEPPRAGPEPDALPRGTATVATAVASVATATAIAAPVVASAHTMAIAPAVDFEVPVLGVVAAEAAPETGEVADVAEVLAPMDVVAVAAESPVVEEAVVVAPDEAIDEPVGEASNAEVAEVAEVLAAEPAEAEAAVAVATVVDAPAEIDVETVVEAGAVRAETVESETVVEAAALVEAETLDEAETVVEAEVIAGADLAEQADDEPAVAVAADDFDREVAARLEAVVGRDPFDDDDVDDVVVEDEEVDADDDFAGAMAAEFGEEGEDDEATEVDAGFEEAVATGPASVDAETEAKAEAGSAVAGVTEADIEVAVPAVVAPVVAADVAVLPTPPRRPPTLAVLIARGADF